MLALNNQNLKQLNHPTESYDLYNKIKLIFHVFKKKISKQFSFTC